ncbi:hypothetical protein GIB67_006345 [Kingdonia uniflora]|uniref:AAA+ ATPase domain-containing protein n=1 Tax=Kingdonia uniflora TaxID=39325 RepID=A0A7J7P0J4_9MAGN|nr:hypothetical protein GIB67_006345 [Kingdonia uniflora]
MDIAAPVSEFIKCASLPAVRHISYLLLYKKNVKGLQSKLQDDLVRLENDVKVKVELARNNGDVIHEIVENWMVKVDKVRDEAERLSHQAVEIDSCLKGWHSARYRLGKESKKKHAIVDELLNEGRSFNAISNPSPIPPSAVEQFVDFASRESTKKEVIEALINGKTNLVAVFGVTGVGKTTLMKQIRKQVEETELFDKVVMATVSQNPDLKKIQTEIAENLGMKIQEKSISLRAARLSERLKKEKKILLILDDLSTRLELAEVGIYPFGDGHNACKVIITSRSLDVCRSMEITICIEVQVLSYRDSLKLFRQKAGVENSDTLGTMSEEIVNVCEGLPLAIVIVARALRGKNECIWADVIPQLRKSMYSPAMSGYQVDPQRFAKARTQTARALDSANTDMLNKRKLSLEQGKMKQAAIHLKQKEAKVKKAIEAKANYTAYLNAVAIENLNDGDISGVLGDGIVNEIFRVEGNDTSKYGGNDAQIKGLNNSYYDPSDSSFQSLHDSCISKCAEHFVAVDTFDMNGLSPLKDRDLSINGGQSKIELNAIEVDKNSASVIPISRGEGIISDSTNDVDKSSNGNRATLNATEVLGCLNGVSISHALSLASDIPSRSKGLIKLNFTPLETIDGSPKVSFKAEEFKESIEEFDSYLIGNSVGKRLEYSFVRDFLIKEWNLKSLVEVTMKNNIFFLKFSSSEEMEGMLKMDPQSINSVLFVIRPWRPFIETEDSELKTIPIWVNLKKVPVHLWTSHGIAKIASFIGTPLLLDKKTEDWTTSSFARVCVEVHSDKDLPNFIPIVYEGIRRLNIEVEYNWIPTKCSACKVFGHNTLKCPKKVGNDSNVMMETL